MLHTVQLNFKLYTVLIFHWTVLPDHKVPGTFFPSILMGELSMRLVARIDPEPMNEMRRCD